MPVYFYKNIKVHAKLIFMELPKYFFFSFESEPIYIVKHVASKLIYS